MEWYRTLCMVERWMLWMVFQFSAMTLAAFTLFAIQFSVDAAVEVSTPIFFGIFTLFGLQMILRCIVLPLLACRLPMEKQE